MAIAFLISNAAEIESGVSTALELSAALDRQVAILCLEPTIVAPESTGKEAKSTKAKAKGVEASDPEPSSVALQFANRVSYMEETQEMVKKQCEAKGFGGPRSEVFEIPVSIDRIRSWLTNPPVTDKLGRFQIETLFIPFNRGVGTEESLDTKNGLFNLVPCEVIFLSAKPDFDWSQAPSVMACVGKNKQSLRTARRTATKFKATKTIETMGDKIDETCSAVAVGVRGRNTHVEGNVGWNSVRKNDQFDLAMAVNPADSFFDRMHWNIENRLLSIFAEYQMTREERERLADELRRGTRSSPEFLLFMSVATFIAAIGLLENSAAVIIGAMLVAPLMTPLLGAGLAMLQGNRPRFLEAVKATTFGVLVAFMIGMGIGFAAVFIPKEMFSGSDLKLTGEMISRSHPNLLDAFIGLAAGLAGGFAIGRDKKIGALAGVAIAAALVPPIATAGLEAAIVLLGAARHGSVHVAYELLARDPSELLTTCGFLPSGAKDMVHVRLIFAPLALFIMNACAVILGTYFGLRLVGMHRTMHPKESQRWVTYATLLILVALIVLLAAIPAIAYYAR